MQIGLQLRSFFRRQFGAKSLSIVHDGFIPKDVIPLLSRYRDGRDREGLDSNVIMAPVAWIMRTFTEAVARVERRDGKIWDYVEGHDLERLIERPNDWYDGDALWKATCLSYVLKGDAYWHKIRNAFGDVIELWYRPHWLIKPHSPQDGSAFIDYYEYHHGYGPPERLAPRDIVHFRFGLDPRDPRCGFSPLTPLIREVMTDDEAAAFSYTVLKNMGVAGFVLAPSGEKYLPNDQEVEKLKDYLQTQFTGEGRGDAMVFKFPVSVVPMGVDPSKMTMSDMRNIAEERVCAMLGLPAAVVGFGSGLEATKVGATMREMRQLAWIQCLSPMQRSMARQLTAQLLSEFVAQRGRFRVKFDASDAATFTEDGDMLAQRVATLVGAGILRVDQGQAMAGIEVDDTQKVYLRNFNVVEVGPDAREDQTRPGQVQPDPNAQPATDPTPTDQLSGDQPDNQKLFEMIATRNGFGNGKHHARNGDTR